LVRIAEEVLRCLLTIGNRRGAQVSDLQGQTRHQQSLEVPRRDSNLRHRRTAFTANHSQISRAIKKLEDERLLCHGSTPTCLLVPQAHVIRRGLGRIKVIWQCPGLEGDPARNCEALLSTGLLALSPIPPMSEGYLVILAEMAVV
jgi:hypothetical protein